MELENKNILVLGLSISGLSVAKYAAKKGASVIITEKRGQTAEDTAVIRELGELGIKVEMGGHSDEVVKNADIIL